MSVQDLKLTINDLLKGENDKGILDRILGLLLHQREQEKEPVGLYTIDGEPLTKAQYQREINEANARIDAGEFFTQEELYKELES